MTCLRGRAGIFLVSAAILALSVLPFARSARYGLVNCDDYDYANYAALTNGVTASGAKWAFTFTGEGIWMPLTWMSYMDDYGLTRSWKGETEKFGEDVYHVMHAHSVLVHGVNGALLFILLLMLVGRKNWFLAALAALFWSLHPLRCESVDWIASRKDVLSMTGLLVALIGWVRWRRGGIAWCVVSLLACAVGGMAKPSVMCYPVLVAVLDWFFLRRDVRKADDVAWLCLAYVLPIGLAVGLGYSAYVMQGVGGCTIEFSDMSFVGRILNAAVSFGVYILHTLVPIGLAPQCILRWPHLPRLMAPGLAALALFVYFLFKPCLSEWKRLRGICVGQPVEGASAIWLPLIAAGLWYAVSIVPFLGISGFGYHALADRFTYIPAVGASVALLAGAQLEGRWRKAFAALLTCVVVAFGIQAWRQTRIWQDDRQMWEHTIMVDGQYNGVAEAGLGLWHYEHGHDLKSAVEHYNIAFALNPDYVQKTCFVYADALAESGDLDRAYEVLKWISWFSQNMREQEASVTGEFLDDVKPLPHFRLARVACFLRDPPMAKSAEKELAELVRDMPKSIHVWYFVARAALLKHDLATAEDAYGRIRELATSRDYVRYRFLEKLLADERAAAGGRE